jgi:hypothetical protein
VQPTKDDVRAAIDLALEDEVKTSPTAVCGVLALLGFQAMTGGMSERPRREVFELVCNVAATHYVYRIHGNTRSIESRDLEEVL